MVVISMKVETQKRDDYLVFSVSGTYDLNDAIDNFPRVIAACRQTGVFKALIDHRGLVGDIPATLDILYSLQAVEFYQTHLSSGGAPIKFAFVGKDPKPWAAGEEIGKDFSVEVLVTNNYQEALDWLNNEKK